MVNLSHFSLDEPVRRVLERGLNFAIAPKRLPFKEIINIVELAIKDESAARAKEIRQDCAFILRNSKPPVNNLSIEEYHNNESG